MIGPCDNCPWRKDAPPRYWHDDHFVSIWSNCQDDGLSLMLCHKSRPPESQIICAGYAIVIGFESIGLRLAAAQGRFDPGEYSANGIELYSSFDALMKAQGLRPPARNAITQDRRPRGRKVTQ